MYECSNCYERFEEPDKKLVDLEDYYGVGSEFSNHHLETFNVCPYCSSDDIEEVDVEEDEE